MEESNQQQLNEEYLILTEIQGLLALGRLCRSDFSNDLGGWTRNVDNFYDGVHNFMGFCARFLDEEFLSILEPQLKKYQKLWIDYKAKDPSVSKGNVGLEHGRKITLQYSQFKLNLIYKKLDEHGFFEGTTYHAVNEQLDDGEVI
jgi:hypothetical protein